MEKSPFNYATPPFEHQRNAFESTRDLEYFAIFWDMGTGKSKLCVDTAQWLYKQNKIDGVIITAEKGYYENWIPELEKHLPDDMDTMITVYESNPNVRHARAIKKALLPSEDLQVVLINIESLSTGTKATDYLKKFIEGRNVLMIVDESTTIKSPTSKRTKNTIRIGKLCKYRRILTGTPITQSPLDIWSQMEFLKHNLLDAKSYTSFKYEYGVWERQVLGSRTFLKLVGHQNLPQLTRKLQPVSSRLMKEDCLTLPDKVRMQEYVNKTEEQVILMNALKHEAMALIDRGEITIMNALGLLTKMLQISSGHVKDDEGNTHRVKSNKMDMLNSVLERIPDKSVLLWSCFREDMNIIQDEIGDTHRLIVYHAGLSAEERRAAIAEFHNAREPIVFATSPRVAGKSLTLTEATYSIYWNNAFNLEHRLQSEDRNHRIGQKNMVTYIDIITRDTPEEKVLAVLYHKKGLADLVLSDITELICS